MQREKLEVTNTVISHELPTRLELTDMSWYVHTKWRCHAIPYYNICTLRHRENYRRTAKKSKRQPGSNPAGPLHSVRFKILMNVKQCLKYFWKMCQTCQRYFGKSRHLFSFSPAAQKVVSRDIVVRGEMKMSIIFLGLAHVSGEI